MQYQVPQFIETEDRIVGPLTLKQFIYIVITAAVSVLLYFITNFTFWLIMTVIVGGAGSALAFIRINGQPLLRLMFSAFRYLWQPQIYIWQPELVPAHEPPEQKAREAGFIERIAAGMALKNAWQQVETGTVPHETEKPTRTKERYQIFQRITGEQRAARRVDYR